jgi:ABC-type multidrug transport system fused ATPase/permease subunit
MLRPVVEQAHCVWGSAFSDLCETTLRIAAAIKMIKSMSAVDGSGPVSAFGFATFTALDRFASQLQWTLRETLPRRWKKVVSAQDSLRRYAFFRYRESSVRVAVRRGELVDIAGEQEVLRALPEVPSATFEPPAFSAAALLLGLSREPSTALAEPDDEASAPLILNHDRGSDLRSEALNADLVESSVHGWCLVAQRQANEAAGPMRWHRTPLRGGFTREGVTFSYPPAVDILAEITRGGYNGSSKAPATVATPQPLVLNDFSLCIPPGATIGICGASGCGKSTLLKLLTRFYEPTGGRIFLDGRPLADYAPRSLRRLCGWVPQKPAIVAGLSVRANILLGLEAQFGMPPSWEAAAEELRRSRREALVKASGTAAEKARVSKAAAETLATTAQAVPGQDAAEAAARAAHIHDEITALARGYDTILEDGMLSGGQVQRLAIARALARQPALLLLDEFSAALDPPAERNVLASIDAARVGRTTIIIAHRMTTIENADFVVFLHGGRIAETGTYRELLARNGAFTQFVGEARATAVHVTDATTSS